ncbi:Fur family transcriptional regulator [Intestinibacter sp.]|uniref:Fur family transcriptional regulator n=1 Tax=Intestinibacter sp. TaxID=1965304 RepID=UPI002A750E73|nr:transcriptional repressor [Intestinibacter sp.]MDY2737157.1 transcriptional repressor [Intestinibacter sp.]
MNISNRGKYKTKQRELILEFLVNNKNRHVTVDEIIEYTRKVHSPVGKTTAYRYMDELEQKGVIRKYTVEKGICACYQYIDENQECHNHFHLKCKVCGELYHLDCNFLNDLKGHLYENHGFEIDSSKTVFYGTCKKCLNKIGGKNE